MRSLLKLFTVILLTTKIISTSAQTYDIATQKIDSIFSSYNSETPGVAIAIVKNGKVIFKKGYGMANLGDKIPITTNTVFNIASVSKQFTAFAIYLLESQGKLSFEDDIRKYFPELPKYEQTIRIRHLLAHTSGIRDQEALASIAGYKANTTNQVLQLLCKQKDLNFAPGTNFGYSNSGYTLLAELVHRVTGKTFSAFATETIFNPLGMKDTWFCDNSENIILNKAESYERINNKYFHKLSLSSNPGSSNLFTTVEDMSKWVLNFEKPIVGNPKIMAAFNESSKLDNGTKVFLRVIEGDTIFHAKGQNQWRHKGLKIFSHGGHTAAYRSFLGRFPEQGLGIIQLSNDEHNERLGGRWDIADFYLKDLIVEKTIPPTPSPVNSSTNEVQTFRFPVEELTGIYYSEELETSYHIEIKNNELVMKQLRLDDLILRRKGELAFTGSGPNTFAFEIRFIRNESGKISSFTLSNFGVKNLKFEKQR